MIDVYVTAGGRQAVARLISEHIGSDARVIHDDAGAPLLAGSTMNISISHSHNFAALAIDPEQRIGVDIEEPRLEQLGRVISKFLAPDELPRWQTQLLRAWTAKEATFKAAGVNGLTIGQIRLIADDIALVPDGRRFLIDFMETADYTLATAFPLTADALYRRGKRRWQLGLKSEALSDFNRSALLDPQGPGALAAGHLNDIFNFFNPDIYNP